MSLNVVDENGELISVAGSINTSNVLKTVYPVGSIYMSVNSINPSSFIAGTTWEQITDKFLVSAGSNFTAGNTGGTSEVSLTTNNLPAHTHNVSLSSTDINHTHTISHTHTRGDMDITGSFAPNTINHSSSADGAFSVKNDNVNDVRFGGVDLNLGTHDIYSFKASDSWTGSTSAPSKSNSGEMSKNNSHTHTVNETSIGNKDAYGNAIGESFSIVPPYLAVYMWKRTA